LSPLGIFEANLFVLNDLRWGRQDECVTMGYPIRQDEQDLRDLKILSWSAVPGLGKSRSLDGSEAEELADFVVAAGALDVEGAGDGH
jgi:hypothetical protein